MTGYFNNILSRIAMWFLKTERRTSSISSPVSEKRNQKSDYAKGKKRDFAVRKVFGYKFNTAFPLKRITAMAENPAGVKGAQITSLILLI